MNSFLALTLYFLYSSCNALHTYERIHKYEEKYVRPKINWISWFADQYANSNQGIIKADFSKIDCHLTPNIIYWEPTHIQFGRNQTYDWVDKGMKYGKIKILK